MSTEMNAEDIMMEQEENQRKLQMTISQNLIGADEMISGPFGSHKQTYADYAASGKAVKFVEDYMAKEVLPIYSNTHTASSFVGIQTSCYREEARGIVRDTVGSLFGKSGRQSARSP